MQPGDHSHRILRFAPEAREGTTPAGEDAQPRLLTPEMRAQALRDLADEERSAVETLTDLQAQLDALPPTRNGMSLPQAVLSLQLNDVTLLHRAIAQERLIVRLIDEVNALHPERRNNP